jgi:hypothetical protein
MKNSVARSFTTRLRAVSSRRADRAHTTEGTGSLQFSVSSENGLPGRKLKTQNRKLSAVKVAVDLRGDLA